MTKRSAPPIYDPLIEDMQNPVPSLRWILFFNQLYAGDGGGEWTPQFMNLTVVGAQPTITGTTYQLSSKLVYFSVRIVPGTNTSSTAGTTYISNFPFKIIQDGAVLAVSGLLGSMPGMIDVQTNRIYVPGWSAVTVPLTIVGIAEAT